MRPFLSITLPALFLVSCGELPVEKTEPETPPKVEEKAPEIVAPEAPAPPDEGMAFAIPDSTNELLTDEKKKTVAGPAPAPKPEEPDQNEGVINIDIPKVPEVKSPE